MSFLCDRTLADGTVHSAGSATYQIFFFKYFLGHQSRILTRSLTLNPTRITDPNPKIKENKATPD